jgi:hypothetical protein
MFWNPPRLNPKKNASSNQISHTAEFDIAHPVFFQQVPDPQVFPSETLPCLDSKNPRPSAPLERPPHPLDKNTNTNTPRVYFDPVLVGSVVVVGEG